MISYYLTSNNKVLPSNTYVSYSFSNEDIFQGNLLFSGVFFLISRVTLGTLVSFLCYQIQNKNWCLQWLIDIEVFDLETFIILTIQNI